MTTYEIAGETVSILTAVENERYIRVSTDNLIIQGIKSFDAWYDSQGDLNRVDKNMTKILVSALMPICEKGVEILADNGIYSIDADLFFDDYITTNWNNIIDLIAEGMDIISEIEDQKQEEIQFRKLQKAGRGRVVGGGFGLGGAVKGMATAGVINATTGMAYSLGNAVGNMGSSLAASANKTSVYKNLKKSLHEAFVELCYQIPKGIRKELQQKANIECKYVTVGEGDQARAIITNYKEGRIPESHRRKQIVTALQLDPYNMSAYELIWNDYGDQNGDLSKMCRYFGGALEEYIKRVSEQYGDEVIKKYCEAYEKAFNKKLVAIECERDIKTALNILVKYCNEHGLDQDTLPHIQRCRDILSAIDRNLKTVHGTVYETRKLAGAVKKDYQLFYSALQDKAILDEQVYAEVKDLNYETMEFQNELSSLYELEKEWRKPEKIENSLQGLLMHNVNEKIASDEWIKIGEKAMEQKLPIIRTITSMPGDEVPLVLVSRSDNGKSGVLITNLTLRIYSKGLFSNENKSYPIEIIGKIQCIDADKYSIEIKGQEDINIPLKHSKLSADDQIALGDFIDKAVKMVNNLYVKERERLYRILNVACVCECGEYLLPEETICPSCRRMLTSSGEFVETQECPNCHNVVMVGKKFCSSCGYSFCGELADFGQKEAVVINPVMEDDILGDRTEMMDEGTESIEVIENVEGIRNKPENIDYVNCPNCGNQILAGKKFCSKCGNPVLIQAEVNVTVPMVRCHKCGNLVKPGKKFCSACGAKMNEKGEDDNE